MGNTCCAAAGQPVVRIAPAALALATMLAMVSPADAASIGHSRMVSAPGQPLHINVPVRELTQAEQQSLQVSAAPQAAWLQAGLTPPVDLATLQVSVVDGFSADSRVIQVRSSQPFNGPVADLLLQLNTTAGSWQHQVSLLANAAPAAPAAAGSGAGGGAPGAASGAPASTGTISVRRGDTMFALARAHAVEGVSVYQMMVALLRANPQAFIEGNLNLVKAGATLAIPDAAALRAVSDREARRIFQQHVQAYAEYRQGIAARPGAAVQGGSAQAGTVSGNPGSAVAAAPAAAEGDQVVLSSGSADDAVQDQRDATQRNIDETETRVSQLERNVQSLNQALQMQGEAAKDAVVEGATAVGQTLTDAAASIGISAEDSSSANGAGPSGASAGAGAESNGAPQGTQASGASGAGDASGAAGTASGAAASATGVPGEGATGASGAAGSAQAALGQAAAAQSASGSQGAGSDVNASGAPSGGQAAGSSANASGSTQAGASTASASSEDSTSSTPTKADQPVSWLQQNLLVVITAVLALLVLVIAWVLRRASTSRGGENQGVITEAMVQERLAKIDLDLATPPEDGRPPRSS